ncbi:MAG TPA: anti-sigma factor [Solirubrobacterales bacterium]|nr:anti-sigma factor [Solirubrobacterales bacterium]
MSGADHNSWSEDLGAYMLGALEPGEAETFTRHLEGCERCQAELRWLQPALHSLPESVERREPPPRLRESLMAEVRGEAERAAGAERVKHRRTLFPAWLLKPAAGLAVVALLVAGVIGYEVGKDDGSDGGPTTIERQVDGIGVKMVQEGSGGTLQLSNLPQVPADKVLEAWVEREGEVEAVPALLVPDRDGHAETTIADMSGVDVVMVTEEPRGGSEAPTGEPIMSMTVQ